MRHCGTTLVKALGELPGQWQLSSHHFLCGISQIACGADTLFSRACQTLKIPQRLFLPQLVEDYLSATSFSGTPDFTPAQRRKAEALLASKHIIQQRIVSQSPNRAERFRETNAEILRVSDAIVCLLRDGSQGKSGGTNELLARAKAIGTPALETRVAIQNSQPVCHHSWHIDPDRPFRPPAIPKPVDQFILPESDGKIPSDEQLKEFASSRAKKRQKLFRSAAAVIITLYILATLCATAALALHGYAGHVPQPAHGEPLSEQAIPWLLGAELVLLLAGFSIHRYLHHSKAPRIWATTRVVAELTRSIQGLSQKTENKAR